MIEKSRKRGKVSIKAFPEYLEWGNVQKIRKGLERDMTSPDFSPESFFRRYTAALDGLVSEVADDYSLRLGTSRKGLVLVSIGGYGRREMSLYSDVDIMVLYQGRSKKEIETFIKEFMYPLWDMGLDIGYSVRTPGECKKLAGQDITIYTSLVESRYLWGDGILYNRYTKEILTEFLRERPENTLYKLRTSSQKRHAHYGRSIFLLEPHVKEGKGGLRDFHAIRWALWAFEGVLKIDEWVTRGIISASSGQELKEALGFLWKTRLCLHMISNRKNDRLTFQVQEEIAQRLGYRHKGHTLDVEVFMRDYYEKAAILNRIMSLVFEKLAWRKQPYRIFSRMPVAKRIGKNFLLKQGKVEVIHKAVFESEPVEMVRVFYFAARYGVDVGWKTKEYITDVLSCVEKPLNQSREAQELFLDIFRKGKTIASTLLQMNQVRLLERMIPEYKNIYCRVQHDVYHIYTVDIHSIFTVGEMERLRDIREGSAEMLAAKLAREIELPFVLFLAGFLHDIGKGTGKGHARWGAKIVGKISDRFSLPKPQKDLLVFLVKNHLLISETAQRRDLFEEKLIVSMAHIIGSVERLKMLFVLTYADIKAVGPEAWNEWKGYLLQEFFFKVLHVLEKGEEGTKVAALRIKRHIRETQNWIREAGLPQGEYFALLDSLPHRYLLQTPPGVIKRHLHLLNRHQNEPVVCDITEDPFKGVSETVVITRDRHGLFSFIAGVMAANGINVLNAEIHTTTRHVAIDIFRVNSPFEPSLVKSGIWGKFCEDLEKVLSGEVDLTTLVDKNRLSSPVRRKGRVTLPPDVRVDNETSDFYTIVDVFADDRVGLLYDITRTLSSLGLDISLAKISTKVDRAADVFYVHDEAGEKILDKERLNEICEALKKISQRSGT